MVEGIKRRTCFVTFRNRDSDVTDIQANLQKPDRIRGWALLWVELKFSILHFSMSLEYGRSCFVRFRVRAKFARNRAEHIFVFFIPLYIRFAVKKIHFLLSISLILYYERFDTHSNFSNKSEEKAPNHRALALASKFQFRVKTSKSVFSTYKL